MLGGVRFQYIIMTKSLLALPALTLYIGAAALLWRGQHLGASRAGAGRLGVVALAAGALLLHGAVLYVDLIRGDLNLGITHSASLIAWAVTALFLLAVLFEPVDSLGIVILPLSAVSVFVAWQWPGAASAVLSGATPAQTSHIIISMLAYSLLSVAVVQSLVLAFQERALHRRQAGGFLRNLPPLETMERLLFRMIAVGFLLLTLTLVSGVFFSEQVFGKPLRFTHHIVLSIVAWAVFGTLLIGRWRFGWRGRIAVRLTLAGFMLLVLGYFGTKFVLEVLLNR